EHIGAAGALQRIDIGAIIDAARRNLMPAPVPGQEHDLDAIELAAEELIGRRAPWRVDRLPGAGDAWNVVQSRAADDAEPPFGHGVSLWTEAPACNRASAPFDARRRAYSSPASRSLRERGSCRRDRFAIPGGSGIREANDEGGQLPPQSRALRST